MKKTPNGPSRTGKRPTLNAEFRGKILGVLLLAVALTSVSARERVPENDWRQTLRQSTPLEAFAYSEAAAWIDSHDGQKAGEREIERTAIRAQAKWPEISFVTVRRIVARQYRRAWRETLDRNATVP